MPDSQEPRWSCRDEGSMKALLVQSNQWDMGFLLVACDTSSEVNSAMSFSPRNLLLVEVDS